MGKSTKIIVAVVFVILVAAGAALLMNKSKDNDNDNVTTPQTSTPSATQTPQNQSAEVAATITYTNNGFEVSVSSIKSGQSVKVVNNSDQELDFDSDPHPVHTDNPELNAGEIPKGESKTFTIEKKGAWGFHNHLKASHKGEITVD